MLWFMGNDGCNYNYVVYRVKLSRSILEYSWRSLETMVVRVELLSGFGWFKRLLIRTKVRNSEWMLYRKFGYCKYSKDYTYIVNLGFKEDKDIIWSNLMAFRELLNTEVRDRKIELLIS